MPHRSHFVIVTLTLWLKGKRRNKKCVRKLKDVIQVNDICFGSADSHC